MGNNLLFHRPIPRLIALKFAFLCRERRSSNGIRVAIVGAGATGLSAAGYLVCRGYEVDLYDKLPLPGGLMTFAIPKHRIPLEEVMEGVEDLRRNFGVEFNLSVKVSCGDGIDECDDLAKGRIDLQELSGDYKALLVATGTWKSRKLGLEGEDARNVYTAIDYLRKLHLRILGLEGEGMRLGRVLVIGGGLSAIDAADESINYGADEVLLVYRRTRKEAPAGEWEMRRLEEKGVKILELASPKRFIVENGLVKFVELQRMMLSEPDETGRPRPVPIEGSEFSIEVDTVVKAIGEVPTPPIYRGCNLLNPSDGLKVDQDFRLIDNIFAAGDVVTGPSKIGRAVKQGLQAARKMDELISKGKIG